MFWNILVKISIAKQIANCIVSRTEYILWPPKNKEHKNDLRNLVIQHYRNGDSQREIAAKTLLLRTTVQYMVEK